jgi:hypothetical protein
MWRRFGFQAGSISSELAMAGHKLWAPHVTQQSVGQAFTVAEIRTVRCGNAVDSVYVIIALWWFELLRLLL